MADRIAINSPQLETQPLLAKRLSARSGVLGAITGPQRLWSTLIVSVLASMTAMPGGYTLAYPSSALLDLRSINDERVFIPDSVVENLFGAMAPLGGLIGGIISGFSADKLGRKPTLVLTVIPNLIGWILIGVSWFIHNTVGFDVAILSGRFFTGFGIGWPMFCAPLYIAEISSPALRGLFSSLPLIVLNIGVLLAYCLGMINTLTYYHDAFIVAGITVVVFFCIVWIPETPRFLIANQNPDKAYKVLKLFRGPMFDVDSEIREIEGSIPQDGISFRQIIHEFKKRNVYFPFILLLLLMMFRQFSGLNAAIFYTAPILKRAGITDYKLFALITVGVIEVVFTFISIFIVDLFGRKILLISSAALMSLSCTGLGIGIYYQHCSDCPHISAIAVISMILFIVGVSIGFDFIPYIMVPELIPLRVRGFLGGVLSALHWGFAALIGGLYLFYAHEVTAPVAWWSFAVINLISVIFVATFLPETKGKKLEVMERELVYRYKFCS